MCSRTRSCAVTQRTTLTKIDLQHVSLEEVCAAYLVGDSKQP